MIKKQNKKGISEMVGYVLLIMIAVGLSIAVYAYLKVYIPKQKAECPPDTNLIIQDAVCNFSDKILTTTITNKGLFKVQGAYIRLKNNSKTISLTNASHPFLYEYLGDNNYAVGLNPGKTTSPVFNVAELVQQEGIYTIEIEPLVITENKIVVCEKAVISQEVECK